MEKIILLLLVFLFILATIVYIYQQFAKQAVLNYKKQSEDIDAHLKSESFSDLVRDANDTNSDSGTT